jgi:hypothetical protein
VVIGLTMLAFRYDGLRHSDFKQSMRDLQIELWEEAGPIHLRPSARMFEDWVYTAGGTVRGVKRAKISSLFERLPLSPDIKYRLGFVEVKKEEEDLLVNTEALENDSFELWPLRLIDFNDKSDSLSSKFVFDVRCLPNPHYDPVLRPMTGRDAPVKAFLEKEPLVHDMYQDIQNFVTRWLPSFILENRSYLTIAVGCTGGQHRSVHIVEELGKHFSKQNQQVLIRHRELELSL